MQQLLLAIDNESLPLKRNLCLYLSKPSVRRRRCSSRSEAIRMRRTTRRCIFTAGWCMSRTNTECGTTPATGQPDGTGVNSILGPNLREGPVCYAESDDGLHWIKPHLGQVEWCGSRDNNIIRLTTLYNEGVHVIKDDEDPNPARRYKMVYNDFAAERKFWTIRTAVSPDGLHWSEGPVLPYNGFLEQCLALPVQRHVLYQRPDVPAQ